MYCCGEFLRQSACKDLLNSETVNALICVAIVKCMLSVQNKIKFKLIVYLPNMIRLAKIILSNTKLIAIINLLCLSTPNLNG